MEEIEARITELERAADENKPGWRKSDRLNASKVG
jgi:hypothetical protein